MKNLVLLLLVIAVATGAFLLGQRNASVPDPEPVRAAQSSPPIAPDSTAPRQGLVVTTSPASSVPPQTFRGPEGRPQLISYEVDVAADSSDPAAVKAGLLSDMQHHPRNIAQAYGFSLDEIAAIVAGKRPFPTALLPPAKSQTPRKP